MSDIVAFLNARLDEQAATLVEYIEKRHKAKMSDAFSRSFMVSDVMREMLPFRSPMGSLNPWEYDAAIYLDADIASKRRLVAAAVVMSAREELRHAADMIFRNLAAAFVGHPEYQEAWKLE